MKKFTDAINGLKIGFSHKAVLVQVFLGILAIIGGIIIKLDYYEWLAFIICIFLVITCEIFNTAIEKIGDYLNKEYDEKIKTLKDLASGAVLMASIGALVICIIVCLRRVI
ncbi:MAG: diacylglycerol kinase family protein [Erysipelotrichaceae bacterium]|nr:diacylglycerol kinase family protein [Erysipelotrichaceae bacterium]